MNRLQNALGVLLLLSASTAMAQNTFPASGNVGVGTATPASLLDVHGSARIGIDNWDTQASSPQLVLSLFSNGISAVAPYSSYQFNTVAGWNSTNKLEINSWDYINGATPTLLTLQGNGNVGIGTTAPAYPLDVSGQIHSTGGIVFPDGSVQTTATGQTLSANNAITQSSGNVGIGTTSPVAKLETSLGGSGMSPILYVGGTMPTYPRVLQNVSASITANDATAATGPVIGLNLENSSLTDNTYSPLITFSRQSPSTDTNATYAFIGGSATGVGGNPYFMSGDLVFATSNFVVPLQKG